MSGVRSILIGKGNIRNYIPVSPNDLFFPFVLYVFLACYSVPIKPNCQAKSVFCVLIGITENKGKRNEKRSCVLFFRAHKMIEFRKVDEFLAICCDPCESVQPKSHRSIGFSHIEQANRLKSSDCWNRFNLNHVKKALKCFILQRKSIRTLAMCIEKGLEMFIGATSTNWLSFFY